MIVVPLHEKPFSDSKMSILTNLLPATLHHSIEVFISTLCVAMSLWPCLPLFARVPELLYQPSLIGLDQCGLAEAVQLVLQYYPPEVQQRMVQVREE